MDNSRLAQTEIADELCLQTVITNYQELLYILALNLQF
ncbi:hypothetical protein GPUN_0501 [Glaciecola punicea ACAM 611]|uniref:Uncharacterized protein n=1 Tax=Glaciecola punicea ACAM 611 TaxID=1121923 RepID=H5T8K7_9ALTE|nr:hypothetical protein GPUN_0501 [Glaciecola punicea ACAM 611]